MFRSRYAPSYCMYLYIYARRFPLLCVYGAYVVLNYCRPYILLLSVYLNHNHRVDEILHHARRRHVAWTACMGAIRSPPAAQTYPPSSALPLHRRLSYSPFRVSSTLVHPMLPRSFQLHSRNNMSYRQSKSAPDYYRTPPRLLENASPRGAHHGARSKPYSYLSPPPPHAGPFVSYLCCDYSHLWGAAHPQIAMDLEY